MIQRTKRWGVVALVLGVFCLQADEVWAQVQEEGEPLTGRIAGQVVNSRTGIEVISAKSLSRAPRPAA